jgi:hypothetical protein
MITYSEEDCDVMWPKITRYLEDHWNEVGSIKDHRPDVDEDVYRQLQNEGKLLCCVAWDGDDIVGFSVDFIQYHLHYKTVKVAVCDSHYIAPAYRAKCARGLTKFIEKVEREMGVVSRITRTKNTNKAGDFFKAMGYVEAEIAWMKRL